MDMGTAKVISTFISTIGSIVVALINARSKTASSPAPIRPHDAEPIEPRYTTGQPALIATILRIVMWIMFLFFYFMGFFAITMAVIFFSLPVPDFATNNAVDVAVLIFGGCFLLLGYVTQNRLKGLAAGKISN
jgi:hypothetical protein